MPREFSVPGDMDAAAMKQQREAIQQLGDADDDVVIDMANVEFIDSSGVGALVFVYKRLTSRGQKLTLKGLNGQPLQILTYLRLTDLIGR